jgi:hypothetical protein
MRDLWEDERGKDMSTPVESRESRTVWAGPLSKPLDEAVWQAWAEKGHAQDGRGSAARVRVMEMVSIAALLAAAALWSHLTPSAVVVRFIVAAGALAVMLDAFRARHYAFAAVCGALAILYNPLAPVFGFSGDWQRGVVAASAAPFLALLAWRYARTAHNA